MLDRVVQTIDRYKMIGAGMRVAVAVSGGADSVCLLHLLVELRPRYGFGLSVIHLDHKLRGEESAGDAEFVRALADRLGLPVTVRVADVAASGDNLEQAAREARLAFFRETVAGGEADRIAVGHTRSDQAETVLYRFLRGAGTAGLAGVRPVTSYGVIRPLLDVERAEVRQYLGDRSIPWREDSTNRSLEFARNRIRHQLLPQLAREWNPAIGDTLAHVADWALAEESYWEDEIGRLAGPLLVENQGAVLVRVGALRELPLAAARRMVRRAMETVKGDVRGIDFRHIAAALSMASQNEGSARCQAPGLDIYRSFDWLRFARPAEGSLPRNYACRVPVPGTVRVPGTNIALSVELIEKPETSDGFKCVYNVSETGELDWRRLSGDLELRNWRPGDQYQPVGSTSREKIKTLFQKARIPLWERRHWPILTDSAAIVWSRRFGPAAELAAGADSRVVLAVREDVEH